MKSGRIDVHKVHFSNVTIKKLRKNSKLAELSKLLC